MIKTIETLQKKIEYLKNKEKQAEEEHTFLYENDLEELRNHYNLFPSGYEYKNLRTNLEKSLEFYITLEKEGIDIDKTYPFMDNIFLDFWDSNGHLNTYFTLNDDSWFYDNFIDSHSGLSEWINDLINEEYELFSGNSSYCHAFGTMGLKDIFTYIEDKEYKNPIDKKVRLIKNLIEFTKEDGNYKDIRKAVVEMLEFRFNKMKEVIVDE